MEFNAKWFKDSPDPYLNHALFLITNGKESPKPKEDKKDDTAKH